MKNRLHKYLRERQGLYNLAHVERGVNECLGKMGLQPMPPGCLSRWVRTKKPRPTGQNTQICERYSFVVLAYLVEQASELPNL